MSENRFFGVLVGILTFAVLALARRVTDVPPAGALACLVVALGVVAVGLVVLHWAADRELAQPLAHPIC